VRRMTAIAALALAASCSPRKPPASPHCVFWSLVKVTSAGTSHAFKCLHEQTGESLRIECFTPVEIPLFDIEIEGDLVTTRPASDAVAASIPFDIRRIGVDVWRVHVAASAADIASFNALSDPDVPEDAVVVEMDPSGMPARKTFLDGADPVAEAVFFDYARGRAGRIVFESFDPPYTIEIIQGAGDN